MSSCQDRTLYKEHELSLMYQTADRNFQSCSRPSKAKLHFLLIETQHIFYSLIFLTFPHKQAIALLNKVGYQAVHNRLSMRASVVLAHSIFISLLFAHLNPVQTVRSSKAFYFTDIWIQPQAGRSLSACQNWTRFVQQFLSCVCGSCPRAHNAIQLSTS